MKLQFKYVQNTESAQFLPPSDSVSRFCSIFAVNLLFYYVNRSCRQNKIKMQLII